MYVPVWILIVIVLIIAWLCGVTFRLLYRVRRLRRLIMKLENPDYEEPMQTGGIEGR